jgi:predicted N-acetyltransferase YhbS
MTDFQVRTERAADVAAIRRVNEEAFGRLDYRPEFAAV